MWQWKKIMRIGCVTLGLLLGLVANQSLVGRADDGSIIGSGNYTTVNVGSAQMLQSASGVTFSSYPNLMGVSADNIKNSIITNRSTKLMISLTGTLTSGSSLSGVYADFMDSTGKTLATSTSGNLITSGKNTVTFTSSTTITINFNWSSWAGVTPAWIGLRVVTTSGKVSCLGFAKITGFVKQPLTPTITTALSANTTVIKGTGTFVGDKISSDASSATTTVASDLSYTLTLGSDLTGKSAVTVTESNDAGDAPGTVTKALIKGLTIASTQTSLQISPDELSSLKAMSDQDLIAWIVKQAGVTANDPNTNSSTGLTFVSTMTGLGTQLGALAIGSNLTVPLHAENSGGNTSPVLKLTLTRAAGTLSFGAMTSDVSFGNLTIPLKETYYAPTSNWNVAVNDTRDVGSNWYLYAQAAAMTTGTHTLKGGLVYRNGSDQQDLSSGMTEVASGQRQSGTTTTTPTSDWSQTKGIVIDALPGIYAGNYQTTVNWTLTDTPQ